MEAVAGRMHGDVTVTKATFGYFEQGVMDRQEYLQPAYALVYVVRNEEVMHKSAMVVPASEKLFELFEGVHLASERATTFQVGPDVGRGHRSRHLTPATLDG